MPRMFGHIHREHAEAQDYSHCTKRAPLAIVTERELHMLVAAFDQLRLGQVREQNEARQFLENAL